MWEKTGCVDYPSDSYKNRLECIRRNSVLKLNERYKTSVSIVRTKWLSTRNRKKSLQNLTNCYWPLNDAFLQYQRKQDNNTKPCITATEAKKSIIEMRRSFQKILLGNKVRVPFWERAENENFMPIFSIAAMLAPLTTMRFQSTNVPTKTHKGRSTQELGCSSATLW